MESRRELRSRQHGNRAGSRQAKRAPIQGAEQEVCSAGECQERPAGNTTGRVWSGPGLLHFR